MKYSKYSKILSCTFALGFLVTSCVQDNLDPDDAPGVGEVADLTLPEADFSFEQSVEDFTVFFFTNESISSTTSTWTIPEGATLIGEGASLSDQNIEVDFGDAEGVFDVGLVAGDEKADFSEALIQAIDVTEPEVPLIPTPVILSAGFEEDDIADARNAWGRNNSSAITPIDGLKVFGESKAPSSRVRTDNQSAKFEDNDPRQAYQEIQVTPNVSYRVSMWIKRGNNDFGTEAGPGVIMIDEETQGMRLAILGETFTAFDLALFEGAIIASEMQDATNEFRRMFVDFNAGDRTTVVIYLDSQSPVEVQVDDVEITVL